MSIQAFRSEIVDTVKALVELNKLKLILVSGLIAVAFGIGTESKVGDYSFLTLSLVPFICLYIDFQYYHGLAKVFVIARFLSETPTSNGEGKLVQDYEAFVQRIREQAAPGLFAFESKALIGSSLFLSTACPCLGIIALLASPSSNPRQSDWLVMLIVLILSSVIGTIIVWLSYCSYRKEIEAMKQVPVILPCNDRKTLANTTDEM